MAEEKMMRISLAAKKLNAGIVTIVEKLAAKGHRIENNPNAKLNFEHLQILANEFKAPSLLDDAPKPIEEAKPSTSNNDILYFRETPKVDTPKVDAPKTDTQKSESKVPEPAVAEKPKQVEVTRIERVLEAPKVLGKIELDKNNNPIVPKSESKVEAPKFEEKPTVVEVPKVEEKPVAEPQKIEVKPPVAETPKTESKIEATSQVDKPKVETPRIEQKPQQQGQQRPQNQQQNDKNRDNRNQRPDNRDRRPDNRLPQPPKEEFKPKPKPVVIESDDDDIELIKAKGEKLQGLKVLGKIELPIEKKGGDGGDKKKRKRKRVKRGEKVNNIDEIAKSKDSNNNRGGGQGGNRNQQGQGSNQQGQGGNSNNNNNNRRGGNNNTGGGGGKRERKEEVSQAQVKEQIKQTMSRMQSKGPDFGSKFRKDKRKLRAEAAEQRLAAEQEEEAILKVTEFISASDLASMMDISVNEVIAACMGMGMFVSINQRLDYFQYDDLWQQAFQRW